MVQDVQLLVQFWSPTLTFWICLFGMGGEQPYRDYGTLIYTRSQELFESSPRKFQRFNITLGRLRLCLFAGMFVLIFSTGLIMCTTGDWTFQHVIRAEEFQNHLLRSLKVKPIPKLKFKPNQNPYHPSTRIFIPSHMLEFLFVSWFSFRIR